MKVAGNEFKVGLINPPPPSESNANDMTPASVYIYTL